MAKFSSLPMKPTTENNHSWYPSVPSLLCPYLCTIWVRTPLTCHACSFFLLLLSFLQNVRGRAYVQNNKFSGNIRAHASLHSCTCSKNDRNLSINVLSRASARVGVRASARILDCNSVCIFAYAHDSMSIRACVPTSIRARSGCSVCLYVVLSKNFIYQFLKSYSHCLIEFCN